MSLSNLRSPASRSRCRCSRVEAVHDLLGALLQRRWFDVAEQAGHRLRRHARFDFAENRQHARPKRTRGIESGQIEHLGEQPTHTTFEYNTTHDNNKADACSPDNFGQIHKLVAEHSGVIGLDEVTQDRVHTLGLRLCSDTTHVS